MQQALKPRIHTQYTKCIINKQRTKKNNSEKMNTYSTPQNQYNRSNRVFFRHNEEKTASQRKPTKGDPKVMIIGYFK